MITIAIDPGKSGAIAYQFQDKNTESYYCPDTIKDIVDLLEFLTAEFDCIAILEKVHSFPGQGVVSTWKFAENYATWKTALTATKIPFKLVAPQLWQKTIGNMPKDKKDRKNYIKAYAQRLYPDIKVTLKNADALAMLSIFNKIW